MKMIFNRASMVKKPNLFVKNSVIRYVFLICLFFFSAVEVWAGTTYHWSVGAKSTDAAKGKVYVGTSQATNSTTYEGEKAVKKSNKNKNGGYNFTFYYSAKAEGEYVFVGWKSSPTAADYVSRSANYTYQSGNSNNTDEVTDLTFDNANYKLYAEFGAGLLLPSTDFGAFIKTASFSFTLKYVTKNAISISSSNPNFVLSKSSISAGVDSETISVTYNGSDAGIARTLISISSSGLGTQYVDVSAVPGTIDNTFTYETGTVNTSSSHPYHATETLGISECFAGSSPAFGELYLFGKTLNKTNHASTSLNVNTAVTPCYVYTRNGNSYQFSKAVNMNSDTKGIGVDVTANGQKLYFSGWCPYASAGYLPTDEGVFHIKGGSNATVDIYLSNAYMYTRTKYNGHNIEDTYVSIGVKVGAMTHFVSGSGGVFVFETTSTSKNQPFKPNVHLRNTNFLQSNIGNYIHVIATFMGGVVFDDDATQCSSPIHMYTTSTGQYETLTIDDIWPSASGTIRTNGAIKFAKAVNQAPSIDLGNGNSVLNINGGQITLANAIKGSGNYVTSFAISCRAYQKEVSGVTATIYGIGGDLSTGNINFNDGTIDVTPLTDAEYTANKNYFYDKKSIKCSENATINGGTYNCAIWKCSDPSSTGASPLDKAGTSLCKLSIPQDGADENGFAQFEIPSLFKPGLDDYYAGKDWTYGLNSIKADETGNVNLMFPCDLIDENAIVSTENIAWVGILPEFEAGAGTYHVNMGGDKTVVSDETHITNRLAYVRMDDYVKNELSNYEDPMYHASVSLNSNDYNKNALNQESYLISENAYVILPLVADRWFAFAAPFDVTKVSVLDAYPDALVELDNNVSTSLQKQASSIMDFFFYLGKSIDDKSMYDIGLVADSWIKCEKEERYSDEELEESIISETYTSEEIDELIRKKFKNREILPYPNLEAAPSRSNFWLYENANEWTYNGKNFTGQTLIGAKNGSGILMEKGKVYSMMFPSEGIAVGDWKYWTGKYIILEGGANTEIAGKNSQPATNESYTSTTKAAIKGNHTLADIASPANLDAFWGYDYTTGTYKHQKSKTNPTQAFLYTAATPDDGTPATLNAIAASGRCYYTISYNSANITVIAAEEYATYSPENNSNIKYFYSSNVWKKITFDNESNLYIGTDNHYYRFNESIQQWEIATYEITWQDEDGNTLDTNQLEYGSSPTFQGDTPEKTSTKQYDYSFSGWSPELTTVSAPQTYIAQFTSQLRSYTITWLDENENEISHETLDFGEEPSHEGLSKASDDCYDYEFEWTPAIKTVEGDESYKAHFIEHQRSYSIVWKNTDGSELHTSEGLRCTDNPVYPMHIGTPYYANGIGYYIFRGWKRESTEVEYAIDAELPNPSSDEIYTALYNRVDDLDVMSDQVIPVSTSVITTTVHAVGTLNIDENQKVTTNNLILEGTPNTSGEIIGDIVATDHAYFDFSNGSEGFKARTWYAVAVPWQVNADAGVIINGTVKTLGSDFDLIYYDGDRRASEGANKTWNYVEDKANHIMYPGTAYMIYLAADASTIRFERTSGKLLTTTLAVNIYNGPAKDANWNGIANPALYHAYINANADTYEATENAGQIYNAESKSYSVVNLSEYQLVVGQPVFIQAMSGNDAVTAYADHDIAFPSLAPRRVRTQNTVDRYEVTLVSGSQSDKIVVRADSEKESDTYTLGQDLLKMSVSSLVPQIWIEGYDSRLCINTAIPTNNAAIYPLGIYAPQAGEYTIAVGEQGNDDSMLYLTYDGRAIWNLSYGDYTGSFEKGTTSHYGLRIVSTRADMPTGVDETTIENGETIRKVIIEDKVYIIRNGEKYSITGQKAQ